MKKIIFLFLLLLVPFCFAGDQYLEIDYNSGTEISHESSFSTFLLKVNNDYGNCKYSPRFDLDYSEMLEFDESSSSFYQENFEDLKDGEYVYYIKCLENETSMKFSLFVDSIVTGRIRLSQDAPLKAGKIEVNLETSKIVSEKPELSYSLDGEKYTPLVLDGYAKNWKSYLVLNRNVGEDVLFFKFEAKDLQGRVGDFLIEGSVFEVDTIKPLKVDDVDIFSDNEEIKLDWYTDEEFERVKIYRKEGSEPDNSDFYDDTYKDFFIDDGLNEDKIYYYKISLVDSAGNEGPLSDVLVGGISKEVDSEMILSLPMEKKVNDFLILISEKKSYLDAKKNEFESLELEEKRIFERLGYFNDLELLFSELKSVESGLENLKKKEISEEDFERKIDSFEVKLDVFDKKCIEDFSIIESKVEINNLTDDLIKEAGGFLSQGFDDSYLKKTKNKVNEYDLEMESNYYLIRTSYYDGSSEKFVIVDKKMDSTLERMNDANFFEVMPNSLSKDSEGLEIKNLKYDFISDGVLKFGSDTKNIFYYYPGDEIVTSRLSFVYYGEDEGKSIPSLTGYFAFDLENQESSVLVFILVVFALFFYLLHIRKKNRSENLLGIVKNLKEMEKLISKGNLEKASLLYREIKVNYSNLHREEKIEVYSEIESVKDKLLVKDFKKKLVLFQKNKDLKVLTEMEEVFSKLSESSKEKIGPVFFRIKKEIGSKK